MKRKERNPTFSMAWASSYSFLASSPTVSSLKIFGYPRFGYRPRSCHVCMHIGRNRCQKVPRGIVDLARSTALADAASRICTDTRRYMSPQSQSGSLPTGWAQCSRPMSVAATLRANQCVRLLLAHHV